MRTTLAVLLMLAVLTSACGSDEEPDGTARAAAVTIRHKFGTTQVPAGAKRVVAVGFNDQDFALALGVVPVGARQFQRGIDIAERSWAQQQLGGRRPAIVDRRSSGLRRSTSRSQRCARTSSSASTPG